MPPAGPAELAGLAAPLAARAACAGPLTQVILVQRCGCQPPFCPRWCITDLDPPRLTGGRSAQACVCVLCSRCRGLGKRHKRLSPFQRCGLDDSTVSQICRGTIQAWLKLEVGKAEGGGSVGRPLTWQGCPGVGCLSAPIKE